MLYTAPTYLFRNSVVEIQGQAVFVSKTKIGTVYFDLKPKRSVFVNRAMKSMVSKGLGLVILLTFCISCSLVTLPYDVTKGALTTVYKVTKFTVTSAYGTCKVIYKVGGFTFSIVQAPMDWPMTYDYQSIGGLPPKVAISKGKVKNAPYVVMGKRYLPMSVKKSRSYREIGTASWYGQETLRQKAGTMTANGEAFDPNQLTAAHKHLPLPTYVRVTNLQNRRSIIVRVNDRGPFVQGRIIDMSAGAAKRLGFYKQGTARVKVESVRVSET